MVTEIGAQNVKGYLTDHVAAQVKSATVKITKMIRRIRS